MDQHLSFDGYVSEICDEANNRLSFLYRYSNVLDFQTRKLLCNSLVLSKLCYCISAWYPGLGVGLRNRLDVLQRKMVRFTNKWNPREHVGDAEIVGIGWLPLPRRALTLQLGHLFKVKIGQAPSYLTGCFNHISEAHGYNTRGSDLNYSANHVSFPPGTFHHSTVREWNRLPNDLKSCRTLPVFKQKLRQYMLS